MAILLTMDESQRITKSFDFAADVTKQLIALSTAIISLCVAFTDKIFSSTAAQSHSTTLLVSLGLFVLSVICGILTLMALAGHLGNPKKKATEEQQNPSPIYSGNVRTFSVIQMLLFMVAIVMAMVYVWKASSTPVEAPSHSVESEKYLKVIRVSDYTIENSQVTDTLFMDSREN